LSATVTAIVIGLLVANIASAARAAEIQHAKQAQIAALQASVGADDTELQLEAYKQRYTEAYNQMVAAYGELQKRDAGYSGLLSQSNGSAAQLEAANASLEARLAQAYQAMQQAQAQLAAMGVSQPAATVIIAPVVSNREAAAAPAAPAAVNQPASTRPAATPTRAPTATPVRTNAPVTTTPPPAAPQPTPRMYCWYDSNHVWVCEDHPQGQ
jgi:hypothetical protein